MMNTNTCPNCGEKLRGNACPDCGYVVDDNSNIEELNKSNSKEDVPISDESSDDSAKQTEAKSLFIRCCECNQEYDHELKACPNCGYPSERQTLHEKQAQEEEDLPQDKSHYERNGSNKKKHLLIVLPILIAGVAVAGWLYYNAHSYERKMARFDKVATEFKATLGTSNQIIAERIDSVAQKVYFLVLDENGYGTKPIKNIVMHDYASQETKSLLPEYGTIEGFHFEGLSYCDSKVFGDRLFVLISSGAMSKYEEKAIIYINIRDNSLHFVESCFDATFLGNNEIAVEKFYVLGEGVDGWGEEVRKKEFIISTLLSDNAYAISRKEHKEEEARLAEEWRNRDIDRIIIFDYTVNSNRGITANNSNISGTLDNWGDVRVFSKCFTVPEGKVWMFKDFSYSGFNSFHGTELFYHKVYNDGNFYPHGTKLEHNLSYILHPGNYCFSLTESLHIPGHRYAKISFVEKVR